jgi:hypothetical protein
MKFDLIQEDYIGKTKKQITEQLGQPARVLDKIDKGVNNQAWIYYPEGTNNFIAIMICFEGDVVSSASYETVM